MKKIICFFIFVNMLFCVFGVSSTGNIFENMNNQICLNDDVLDQAQIVVEDGLPVGNFQLPDESRYNWSIAQSYTPGLVVLTRVKLLLARNSIPPTVHPLVMTIRKTLTGENLVKVTVDPEEVLEFPDYDWVEFDFEDIAVDAGNEYFIVCYTVNETDNAYVWGANPNNLYPAGQVYISLDNGNTWDGDPPADTADMCFMTYGRNNTKPEPPIIDGPTNGKAGTSYDYNFTATDPDGDDIWYFIEWGDESNSSWVGPYDSGEEVTKSHTWDDEDTYTIRAKAKDIFDAEGGWGTLEITMPVNQQSSHPWFTWFFERFPNAFPILRYLLEAQY